jgi:glycosyltransferase involved in cell wall biosynthesis
MATQFSSILRGINRPDNDKLNIFTVNCEEKFQDMLAKTGHNFYYLNVPNTPMWNPAIREKPDNCILLLPGEAKDQVNMGIDLVICQQRARDYPYLLKIVNSISCPIISVNNFLPFPEMNQFVIQALADQISNKQIFCSKFVCNAWGLDEQDVMIMPKCVDTDIFNGWTGCDNKVLLNVDYFQNRKGPTGFDILEKIGKQIKLFLIGMSPGFSAPAKDLNELVDYYRRCSVFLNTSTWLSCPYELLEAMAVGCPVVTTKTTDIQDVVVDGENGFITNDIDQMVSRCKELMNDKDLARKIGNNARQTILDKFGHTNFIEKWNEIFYSTIDTPCATLVD